MFASPTHSSNRRQARALPFLLLFAVTSVLVKDLQEQWPHNHGDSYKVSLFPSILIYFWYSHMPLKITAGTGVSLTYGDGSICPGTTTKRMTTINVVCDQSEDPGKDVKIGIRVPSNHHKSLFHRRFWCGVWGSRLQVTHTDDISSFITDNILIYRYVVEFQSIYGCPTTAPPPPPPGPPGPPGPPPPPPPPPDCSGN